MRAIVPLLAVLAVLLPAQWSAPAKPQSEEFEQCEARCSKLSGTDRYRCIKLCMSAKRKKSPGSKDDIKKRMEECEESCADIGGVDRIKCIRVCLDEK